MQSYKDLIKYFGLPLSDKNFQIFINNTFNDFTDYNVAESEYIISEKSGIELGFTNSNSVLDDDDNIVLELGTPIFSHFNIYPLAVLLDLPFSVSFSDKRNQVVRKAGEPFQMRNGEQSFMGPAFLVDNYKLGNLVVTFDYNPEIESINFIQIRDNNLVKHLKL